MADGAFPRDRTLTAIAIGYKNPDTTLIADQVLPRTPVGKKTFEWITYPLAQSFTIPDTRVGEKGQIPQLELKGEKVQDTCEDRGLSIPLTADEISQAAPGFDPLGHATEQATGLMLLDRERIVATKVFDPDAYAAANKADLSASAGANQFSNANADPIKYINEQFESCLVRPNVFVCGSEVWNKLSMHPKVVAAAIGNSGQYGRATRERVAELLEVSEVIVGAAWVNSVKQGKTPSLVRCWGKHALGFYRDRTATTSGGLTFGFTAQFEQRFGGVKDIDLGVRGGKLVRAAETVKECIVAPAAAFFFEKAVA